MTELALPALRVRADGERPAAGLAVAALAVVVGAALLAGFVPLGFSIATVFLFAGPHNWLEFRYFLSRMPPRWGALRWFFLTGLVGTLTLAGTFVALAVAARRFAWSEELLTNAGAVWNSALVLWVSALVALRQRERGRVAAGGADVAAANAWLAPFAVGFLLVGGVWLWPTAWEVGLVYLHPLIALWFLDRELARQRPAWQRAYRQCLLAVPVALAVLWWRLADAPPLAGNDLLTMRITQHAGADVMTGVSSHALVATHTFVEMLHYGVWLVAIPLVALRGGTWRLTAVPLARRSDGWRRAVLLAGVVGGLIVIGLWGAFLANYPLTRDVYFTIAIGHVLAEVTFLLRLL